MTNISKIDPIKSEATVQEMTQAMLRLLEATQTLPVPRQMWGHGSRVLTISVLYNVRAIIDTELQTEYSITKGDPEYSQVIANCEADVLAFTKFFVDQFVEENLKVPY